MGKLSEDLDWLSLRNSNRVASHEENRIFQDVTYIPNPHYIPPLPEKKQRIREVEIGP